MRKMPVRSFSKGGQTTNVFSVELADSEVSEHGALGFWIY